jgi:hypothetical protein
MPTFDKDPIDLPSYHLFTQPADKAVQAERSRPWAGEEFSFHDVLDAINPLQHIPVVSAVYRWLTGDTIGAVPRIAGDTLYGGPLGFLSGLVGATLKQESGGDVGEHMIAMATGGEVGGTDTPATPGQAVAVADADSAATPAAAGAITTAGAAAPVSAAAIAASASAAAGAGVAAPLKSAAVTSGSGGVSLAAAASPSAPVGDDPRAAFLARGDAVRRFPGAQAGRPQTNRPVPLEGVGIPPGFAVPRPQLVAASAAPATKQAPTSLTPAPASTGAAAPAAETGPAGLTGNPPIDISRQMLDALDKYARLHQQRGAQLDVVQ